MKFLNKIIEWGIYLFVFLLPWQTRLILKEGDLNGYWEYGTASVYGTEILLYFLFLLAIASLVIDKLQIQNYKSQINYKFKITKIATVAIFFFVFALLSIFWADSKSVALMAGLRLVEGVGIFLILQIFNFDWKKISRAFVLSALVQVGLGIYQFLTQTAFASKWLGMALHDPATLGTIVVEASGGRWLRAYGSLPHPNMLGAFLAIGMFLIIILYQKSLASHRKIILVSIFSILTFGLFTTFSKSAILAFIIVLLFFLVGSFILEAGKKNKCELEKNKILFFDLAEKLKFCFRYFKKGSRQARTISNPTAQGQKIVLLKFTFLFIFIATIFSIIFWEPVATRVRGIGRLEAKSTNERISYFGESWQLIKNHPFLGVGLGNYTLALHNEINSNLNSWEYQPAHNIYLLVLAELGIFGFLIFTLFLLYFLLPLQKNISWYNLFDLRDTVFFLILLVGLFDHYLWTLYFGIILFWVCFNFICNKDI